LRSALLLRKLSRPRRRMADIASALEKLTAVASPVPPYNTDLVRQAWNSMVRARRDAVDESISYRDRRATDPLAWAYVSQLWTDHIIVELDNDGGSEKYIRVPYTVNAPASSISDVVFGEPVRVREVFVAASAKSRENALERVRLAAQG
jgi:hypothetical protein